MLLARDENISEAEGRKQQLVVLAARVVPEVSVRWQGERPVEVCGAGLLRSERVTPLVGQWKATQGCSVSSYRLQLCWLYLAQAWQGAGSSQHAAGMSPAGRPCKAGRCAQLRCWHLLPAPASDSPLLSISLLNCASLRSSEVVFLSAHSARAVHTWTHNIRDTSVAFTDHAKSVRLSMLVAPQQQRPRTCARMPHPQRPPQKHKHLGMHNMLHSTPQTHKL